MEARVVGARNMAAPGACAAARVGEGSRGAGMKIQARRAPACSLPLCSWPQPRSKARTHSCTRDSLQIERPDHCKGRRVPGRPAAFHAPPRDLLRPAPPSGTQRTPVSFESLPQNPPKETITPTLHGRGKGTLLFLFTFQPPGFAHFHSTFRKLKWKSHGGEQKTWFAARFVLSTARQFHSSPSPR